MNRFEIVESISSCFKLMKPDVAMQITQKNKILFAHDKKLRNKTIMYIIDQIFNGLNDQTCLMYYNNRDVNKIKKAERQCICKGIQTRDSKGNLILIHDRKCNKKYVELVRGNVIARTLLSYYQSSSMNDELNRETFEAIMTPILLKYSITILVYLPIVKPSKALKQYLVQQNVKELFKRINYVLFYHYYYRSHAFFEGDYTDNEWIILVGTYLLGFGRVTKTFCDELQWQGNYLSEDEQIRVAFNLMSEGKEITWKYMKEIKNSNKIILPIDDMPERSKESETEEKEIIYQEPPNKRRKLISNSTGNGKRINKEANPNKRRKIAKKRVIRNRKGNDTVVRSKNDKARRLTRSKRSKSSIALINDIATPNNGHHAFGRKELIENQINFAINDSATS